jgi:hypothetical protein
VLIVRPGDGICRAGSQPHVVRAAGHAWPYADELTTTAAAPLLG